STDDVTIIVSQSPTVANAGSDQNICAATTTLAGNTPVVGTGTWSLVSGTATITNPSSPTSTVTALTAGSYTLKWTISNGSCTPSSDNMIITVNSAITANAGPDQNICILTTTLTGNSPNPGTGSWSVVSGIANITNPNSPTSSVTGLGIGNNVLRWTISNPSPCATSSDDVTIVVNNVPIADAGPDKVICTVSSNSTTIGTTPVAGNTYAWTPTTGLNNAAIANPIASPSVN